jgi:flagellar motor switch protein FliM
MGMAEVAASVLQRKVAAGGEGTATAAAARALGQALARAAHGLFALPLRVQAQAEAVRSLAELPEILEDQALLALLDGPGEAIGLCALGPGLLSALIEVQTTGCLAAAAPAARRPTRTDAAMMAGFVDAALAGLGEEVAETEDAVWAEGFHYASCLDDPRPLPLLLEDGAIRVLRLGLRLGEAGEREGTFLLALPADGRGARHAEAAGPTPEARDWYARLERALLAAPIEAEAVIARIRVTADAMLGLRPGMLLPVPADCVARVSLEVGGGGAFARGRLGRFRGARALRIEEGLAGEPPGPAIESRPLAPPLEGLGTGGRGADAGAGASRRAATPAAGAAPSGRAFPTRQAG